MFNIYFIHGWGFDKNFWLPAAKYLEQNDLTKSLFYIDLDFFGSSSENIIQTNSKMNIFITHSYGLCWFLKKKIDCRGILNFFSAPSFINYQKNPKKVITTLDLMIKKFENSPILVLEEFYKKCGITKKILIEKINSKKLLKGLRDLRLKNYEEDFLRLSNKILNVFATEDKIFNLSPEKLHFLIDCKKKYVLINSDKHAYPFLQPKETALIIKNYLKTLKNEEFEKKISRSFDRGSKFYEFNSDIQKNICLELINFYKNLKINRDRMKFENALDIGCGSGFMTNQINRLENFSKIHLIDISKKMISKAKQNLSNEKFSF